jgi:protein-S-isoprenylcysteine O-methyltransferase Ste14
MLGKVLTDPWFWAFLAAVGWGACFGIVGTQNLGRRLGFGITVFILAEFPRFLIPLPFVDQPRIEPLPAWLVVVGGLILVVSLYFGTPVFQIVPLTAPDRSEPLRTRGLYSIVRHPLMLCDIFWPLGWSLIFGSVIGIALTPAWLFLVWVFTNVEEDALIREYGDDYREFQARVPRLFPRIPGLRGRQNAGQ